MPADKEILHEIFRVETKHKRDINYVKKETEKMGRKILLVEDELEMVEMVKTRLEANNYEVITASDGQDGLDKARKEKPDLIILDILLPKMDGYKVCGLLKTDIKHNKIPVVMLTVKSQESDKKLGKEAGAAAYIIKPFEAQALLEEIRNLLEG